MRGSRSAAPATLATTAPATGALDARQGFSLVLGGPLYQALRRVRLSDDVLGLVHRRIVAAILILWAPLVVLSALQGELIGADTHAFLRDIGFQLRFLLVVPLLIVAEPIVHWRMRPIVEEFRVRGLVRPNQMARFEDAVSEAMNLRNSVLAEGLLLAVVYGVGLVFTWGRYRAFGTGGWYADPTSGQGLSIAGLWLVFVSLPLLQFLLLRWYLRLFIWTRFLWRVSRLDLDLDVAHPDKAGGLGFLSESLTAFLPIALAHGVLMAGMLTNRILYAHAKLTDFEWEVVGGAVLMLLLFASPLTVFSLRLARVKREGLRRYGALANAYVREFRAKWLESEAPPDEPLIGSSDIQSLADLGNSYSAAEQMRFAPIRLTTTIRFVIAFLAPIAPLLLTVMPAEKLLAQVIGLVF
jgi:hypothetical protein